MGGGRGGVVIRYDKKTGDGGRRFYEKKRGGRERTFKR